MRGRCVSFDLDGPGVVLSVKVVERIKLVLPHIAQTTAIVVPIPAMRTAHATRNIRFQRARTTVHVPVKIGGHGFRSQIDPTGPLLDLQSAVMHIHRVRLLQQTARHDLAGHHVRALAGGHSEPPVCAHLEDPPVTLRRIDHRATLADKSRHRLLADDVLSGLHRRDADQRMPVRRRRDRDDVDILTLHHAAKIGVDRLVVALVDVLHVAHRQLFDVQTVLSAEVAKRPSASTAASDQRGAKRLAGRRGLPGAAEDVAGNDRNRRSRGRRRRAFHQTTTCHFSCAFFHWAKLLCCQCCVMYSASVDSNPPTQ